MVLGRLATLEAENDTTPVPLLAVSAKSENLNVRKAVAKNSRTPLRLSNDKEVGVRMAVAKHRSKNADTSILNKLRVDKDEPVRIAAINNLNNSRGKNGF